MILGSLSNRWFLNRRYKLTMCDAIYGDDFERAVMISQLAFGCRDDLQLAAHAGHPRLGRMGELDSILGSLRWMRSWKRHSLI